MGKKMNYAVIAWYDAYAGKSVAVAIVDVRGEPGEEEIVRQGVRRMLDGRSLRVSELDGAEVYLVKMGEGDRFTVTQEFGVERG